VAATHNNPYHVKDLRPLDTRYQTEWFSSATTKQQTNGLNSANTRPRPLHNNTFCSLNGYWSYTLHSSYTRERNGI